MSPSKIVIAAFALSATAAMANTAHKQSPAQSSMDQSTGVQASSIGDVSQDGSTVRQAQQALKDRGYDAGKPDGIAGPQTEAAVKKFQLAQGLSGSGQLDQQTLAALDVSVAPDQSLNQDAAQTGATSPSQDTTQQQSQ